MRIGKADIMFVAGAVLSNCQSCDAQTLWCHLTFHGRYVAIVALEATESDHAYRHGVIAEEAVSAAHMPAAASNPEQAHK